MGVWSGRKLAINGVIADFGSETLRTKSGHLVDLRPQSFAVLRYLAEHAGQLVTKDELMQAVWPGIAVTEDSLVQCIHEIRRALHDDERALLKTAQKRGYRLVLPAETVDGTAPGESDRVEDGGEQVSLDAASSVKGARPTEHAKVSIAVLPFVNMSSDPEQEYFSDGITEDIITDLSRWPSLAVASRNSTSRLKGQPVDMQTAGRELNVRFLVEGSVRRMGERVRITAQLIDAETGNHVWAERFDRPMADLFVVQDEVVRTIVGTLVGRVYVSAAERLRRKPPSNPAAYDLTLRGNWLPWDDPTSRAEAKRCFEQAIEFDPRYGLPHSLLALMLRYDWSNDFSGSPEILDQALALAKRGVELADNESNTHMALGLVYLDRRSYDLALRHMERAVEINPANPWNQADFGNILCHIGRAEEGLERLRSARRADPYFGPSWYWPSLGFVQFVLRRYSDAMADFDRGAPGGSDMLAVMAGCCAKLGLADRARDLVEQVLTIQPEATVGKLVDKMILKDPQDSEHLAECLRLAGMPE